MPISGVLERIESNLNLLSGSEAKAARWIMENPEEVLHSTVRDLARQASSSPAAVIRLLHTLNIDGYSTLKVLLTADLVRKEQRLSHKYAEANGRTSFDQQLQSFANVIKDSIYQTVNNLNPDDLEKVNVHLRDASRIFLFGMAESYIAAEDLAQNLIRLGYPVALWRDIYMAMISVVFTGPRDVVVLVSFSGETREVLELAEHLRKRDAFVVAITRYRPKNRLAETANVTFYVSAQEPALPIGAATSVLASILIGGVVMLWMTNQDSLD